MATYVTTQPSGTIYYGPGGAVSLYPLPGYTTSPTTTSTAPAPTGSISTSSTPVPPEAISTVTGIDPNEVAAATYGKIIPIWIGGMPRLGCHIIFGPTFSTTGGITSTSFGVSFGMPANNTGTRELRELRLDGFKVWSLAEGTLYTGLTFRFYGGTETQAADPLVTAAFPSAPVAHKGQACVFIENLPLTDFAGKVPFVSALIADTTVAGDPADGVNLGDALETLAASPYVNLPVADFETDGISERVDAIIVAEKVSFLDLLNRYARLHLWDVVQRDKLKVIERGTVVPDLSLDLTHILMAGDSPPILIERRQQTDIPRELDYSYIDIDRDYEINTVTARRPRAPVAMSASAGKETIALPSVHTVQEAISWASLRRFKDELARETVRLTTTIFGFEIEPGDVVAVDAGFRNYVLRITESLKGANWTNRIRGEPVLRCALPVSAAPLDGVACVRSFWSLSRNLVSTFTGPRYVDLSGAILTIYDQSEQGHHFNDGGATTRPLLTTAGPNSRLAADFDGTNDYMDTATDLSEFVTNSVGYVLVSVIIDAVTLNQAAIEDNHAIVGDASQRFGIYASAANTLTIYAFNNDGIADHAGLSTLELVFGPGDPLVISVRHESGTLYIRLNNGGEVSVASGNTNLLTGDLRLAMSDTGTNANIKVFEVATFNCAPPEGTRNALEQDFMAWIGASTLGGVPSAASFTIAYNASDSAPTDFGAVPLTFDSETVDTAGCHDLVINNGRLTIPASLNGKYAIIHAFVQLNSVTSSTGITVSILKNGALYVGSGMNQGHIGGFAIDREGASTAPTLLVTGDFYEVLADSTDTATVLEADVTSFSLYLVG